MSQIKIPNEYPVELTAPDITPYAKGNTGIPYLWQFDSGRPGPNVMISAVVHGNELCGAIAVDRLLREDVRPLVGTLTLAFMNVEAFQAFDPENPNATRWIDDDFNRVWGIDVLEGERQSCEIARAREVRPALDEIDLLLDIHSMQDLSPPLMLSGRLQRSKDLAARVGVPERVLGDFGHASGRRMRDYDAFDREGTSRTALLVECGQHWERASGDLAWDAALRFLVLAGQLPPDRVDRAAPAQQFFTVAETVTIETDDFNFVQRFNGGEVIAEKGTVIAYDGEKPITTPADDMMLVMPTTRKWIGQTAVRLAVRDAV